MNTIEFGQKWKKKDSSFLVKIIEVQQDYVIVALLQPSTGKLQTGPTIIRIEKDQFISRYQIIDSAGTAM